MALIDELYGPSPSSLGAELYGDSYLSDRVPNAQPQPPQQPPARGFTNPVLRALSDVGSAVIETPMTLATGTLGGLVGNVIGIGTGFFGGKYGTPEGAREAASKAQQIAHMLTYQPRGEGARAVLEAAAPVFENVAAVPIPTLQQLVATARPMAQALKVYGDPAIQQVSAAPVAIANALKNRSTSTMPGVGAAQVTEANLRQARAQELGLQLTKGEQLRDLAVQQFESEITMQKPATVGKPLIEFRKAQEAGIHRKFQEMAERTGAEFADPDPAIYRKIGSIVDDVIVKEFEKRRASVDTAYTAARASGETKQLVSYQAIVDYIDNQAPTTRAKLAPILDAAREQMKKNDPKNTGLISIDNLETIYQDIGRNAQPGTPNAFHAKELKKLINQTTEGAGGDLYRAARAERTKLAAEFEDVERVAKLLGTKGGYQDRAVALSDVFHHVVLDGSKEQMLTVTRILKNAGPAGEQAMNELAGQTVQYIRGQLTKNASGQMSFARMKNVIDAFEREDKLTYLFGKQGSQEMLNLRAYLKDVLVKEPGAVNYSQSGNLVLRNLQDVLLKLPGAKTIAETAKDIADKRRVKQSITYDSLKSN